MFYGYKLREYATFTENSWNIKHGLTFFIEVEYLFYQLLDTRGVKISVEDRYSPKSVIVQSLGLMRGIIVQTIRTMHIGES